MNFGIVILTLLLICGAIFSVYSIAQSTQGTTTDTFGNISSPTTNLTHGNIENSTAKVGSAAGGLGLLVAITLVFVGIVYTAGALSKHNHSTSRR